MVVLAWVFLGLMAGFVASWHFSHTGSALAVDITLGAVGAIGGGLAMNSLAFAQPTVYMVAGLFGALAGSVAILAGYRSIFRRA